MDRDRQRKKERGIKIKRENDKESDAQLRKALFDVHERKRGTERPRDGEKET